ncbi:uncharacterized protein LOC129295179 isoform X2 [Prosopis cineraria]|uniref:uncharacterized protein LOC129295179 isoform X2 n=1 Tax=Prosopis cineraria TaxID=364024 RepID=UPI00240FE150|nr:uncharacterized protein LOC129295179 isoform X2 [Prosopis cineraria]
MSSRVNGFTSIPLGTFRQPFFRRCFRFWKHLEMEESVADGDPELIVGDPDSLANKIAAIRSAGPQKLQGNPKYDAKRQELYEYYHPLEFSPDIGLEEKTKLMEEWWSKSHALLIEGGLTNESIIQSVANGNIAFREGVFELFEFLEEKGIPVLIFSAGLGDIIEEVLRQKLHRIFTNVRIVSNRMVFDDDGHLASFKGKLIHSLNKNEHALDMGTPVHSHLGDGDDPTEDNASVKNRTNVLLLGDHVGDLGMSDGLNYETRISVGFLNHNIENSLSCYQESFDVVLLNDAPMTQIVKLVSSMCSKEE